MKRFPHKAIKILEGALEEIKALDPTGDEIEKFAEKAGYGIVTSTENENYFGPRLHNTWGVKFGGRVHIDIGCCGYHLMLDKKAVWEFIEFIKSERKIQ